MLKQSLLAIAASILVILFLTQMSSLLFVLIDMHYFVARELAAVFAGGQIGNIIRSSIALFLIPFIIAGVPTLIYWSATRTSFAYFNHVLWVSWLIMATVLIAR